MPEEENVMTPCSKLLVIISSLFASQALAQVCCPKDCVQDGNRCVTTGPQPRACQSVACPPGTPRQTGPGGGDGPIQGPSANYPMGQSCFSITPTAATVNAALGNCVKALTANAQLAACLFEDNAGRQEDKRTGRSCPERQAAMAQQCRPQCTTFANAVTKYTCQSEELNVQQRDAAWRNAFGNLAGPSFGSANIAQCGPPLLPKGTLGARNIR